MDKRRNVNLPEPPRSFTEAIRRGGMEIRIYERRKRRALRAAAIAACISVCLIAMLAVVLRPAPVEDVTLSQDGRLAVTEVWIHPDDAYRHADEQCPQRHPDAVKVPVETAKEFGKEACEKCGG